MWKQQLDDIRNGRTPIATSESGTPLIAQNAPVYELMQFVAALTAGYNRNLQRIEMLRKAVKTEMEGT